MKVPVADSCSDSPTGNEDELGVTEIDTSAAGLTVREADPAVFPTAALTVALPIALAVAIPVAFTAATEGPEELQVADCVRSRVDWSVKVPVADSCSDSPTGNEDELGAIAIDTSAAGLTFTEADPLVVPTAALTVAFPIALAVAIPVEFTAATEDPDELHVADCERS